MYVEESVSSSHNISWRLYAHRSLQHIMVVELELVRAEPTPTKLTLQLKNRWTSSYDITFTSQESGVAEVSYKRGRINARETESSPSTEVHILYDHVPPELTPHPTAHRTKWVFLTAIATNKQDALRAYEEAKTRIHSQDSLYTSHIQAWADLWRRGRIDLTGDLDLSRKVYSSWYYLLSSVPDQQLAQEKFRGVSPCGLPLGDMNKDYQGRVTSDQELWLFPPLLYYHPSLARLLLLSRQNTASGAADNARLSQTHGIQFSYESASTGREVSGDSKKGQRALYVSAGVSMAIMQYLHLTNDTAILTEDHLKDVINNVALFILGQTTVNTRKKLEIKGVLSLDTLHPVVDNSALVNSMAREALHAPHQVARMLNYPTESLKQFEGLVYIPFDKTKQFHPAFDGYKKNSPVHQADTVLLGYLSHINSTVQKNDLRIYERVTDSAAPPTTWAAHAIGWLGVNEYKLAAKSFNKQLNFSANPFQVWTERLTAPTLTAVNFISGAAAFLQSIHNGYGGFRIHSNRLELKPVLPPNVTSMHFKGVHYLGNSIDVLVAKDNDLTIILSQAGSPLKLIVYSTGAVHALVANSPLKLHAEKISIFPASLEAHDELDTVGKMT